MCPNCNLCINIYTTVESAKKLLSNSFSHQTDNWSGLFVSQSSFTLSILVIILLLDNSNILFQNSVLRRMDNTFDVLG